MNNTTSRAVSPESLLRQAGSPLNSVGAQAFALAFRLWQDAGVAPERAVRMLRAYLRGRLDFLPASADWAIVSMDIGSVSLRVGAVSPTGHLLSVRTLAFTKRPPDDIDEVVACLREGLRRVVVDCSTQGVTIVAIAIASTIPNHLLLGQDMRPVHPMVAWNDATAAEEAIAVARHNDALGRPLSPNKISGESVLCRLRHLFSRDPALAARTDRVIEMCEYLGLVLTGELRANLAARWWRWSFTEPPAELLERVGLAQHADKLRLPGLPMPEPCGVLRSSVAALCGLPDPVPVFVSGWDTLAACAALSVFTPGVLVVSMGTSWNVMMSLPPDESAAPTPLELVHLPGVAARLAAGSIGIRDVGVLLDDCRKQFCRAEIDAAERAQVSVHEVMERRIAGLGSTYRCLLHTEGAARTSGQQLTMTLDIGASGITPLHVYAAIRAGCVDQVAALVNALRQRLPQPASVVRVCGGFAKSDLVCQQLANGTQRPVQRGAEHAVIRGAALLAYTHMGYYQSYVEAAHAGVRMGDTFLPDLR